MEKNKKKNSFKKLLDRLQEESWQLELLISGFAIFGLFYALEPVVYNLQLAQYDNNQVFVILYIIVHFSIQILIFNLLVHVLLRGLWIGSLGLRYVFGDIDFDKLNYSEQFNKYLRKNIGSFDAYINKLENICSVIFSISFLLVFYIFSFFIICFILIGFNTPAPDWLVYILRPLFVLFAFGTLLTFFDFITQGLLKKNKWISKIYFPFYRFFSILTLSFLYRPLVYNLLDNKHGRRISLGLIPFYFLIYVVFHLNYQKSNFITQESTKVSNSIIANSSNYEDIIKENNKVLIGSFAIQSKVISEPYLKLIVPLSKSIEDSLIQFNSEMKPINDKRGLYFRSVVTFNSNPTKLQDFSKEYLTTFENYYRFKIDTTYYKTEFIITNFNYKLTLESYIGIKDLLEGKHIIEFQSLKNNGTDTLITIGKIPFWYYKN